MPRSFFLFAVATAGLLISCKGACGCPPLLPPGKIVYGRVESATGSGVPTAVVQDRLAFDSACVFDLPTAFGEIDVGVGGRFRGEIYGNYDPGVQCLELRAFDPATGKADTVSILTLVDFTNSDSTGVVLRLP